jgi:hypothetical protein
MSLLVLLSLSLSNNQQNNSSSKQAEHQRNPHFDLPWSALTYRFFGRILFLLLTRTPLAPTVLSLSPFGALYQLSLPLIFPGMMTTSLFFS